MILQRILASMGVAPSKTPPLSVAHFCRRCVGNLTDLTETTSKFLLGQNSNQKLKTFITTVGIKMNIMSVLFTQQCHRIAALRLRRAYQILLLYQRIYGEQLLMQKIKSNVRFYKNRPLLALFSATIFQWEKERITDDELQKCTEDIEEVHELVELSHKSKQEIHAEEISSDWEQIVDTKDFKLWRRHIPHSTLYQYRVYGHFSDIPARAFYNTQVDVEYWKVWDKNTMEVSVVDRDDETDSMVLHWKYKFPYPMYPRDYVYVRRCKVDSNSSTMIISARATEHPKCPEEESCVRVSTYCSQMVIKPYTTFDENGFDYLMTYFDDPQTNFPPLCYNWMASTGVHEFLEKIHKAARKKHERTTDSSATRIDNSSGNIYTKMVHH